MIDPKFWSNDQLADLPPVDRLIFIGLWQIADREGRFEWRPSRIKAELFPIHTKINFEIELEASLARLVESKVIQRYASGSLEVGLICNFKKHQKVHERETRSKLPGPPRSASGLPRQPGTGTESGTESGTGESLQESDTGVDTSVDQGSPKTPAERRMDRLREPVGELAQWIVTFLGQQYDLTGPTPVPLSINMTLFIDTSVGWLYDQREIVTPEVYAKQVKMVYISCYSENANQKVWGVWRANLCRPECGKFLTEKWNHFIELVAQSQKRVNDDFNTRLEDAKSAATIGGRGARQNGDQ